jgi:hypothetical protein
MPAAAGNRESRWAWTAGISCGCRARSDCRALTRVCRRRLRRAPASLDSYLLAPAPPARAHDHAPSFAAQRGQGVQKPARTGRQRTPTPGRAVPSALPRAACQAECGSVLTRAQAAARQPSTAANLPGRQKGDKRVPASTRAHGAAEVRVKRESASADMWRRAPAEALGRKDGARRRKLAGLQLSIGRRASKPRPPGRTLAAGAARRRRAAASAAFMDMHAGSAAPATPPATKRKRRAACPPDAPKEPAADTAALPSHTKEGAPGGSLRVLLRLPSGKRARVDRNPPLHAPQEAEHAMLSAASGQPPAACRAQAAGAAGPPAPCAGGLRSPAVARAEGAGQPDAPYPDTPVGREAGAAAARQARRSGAPAELQPCGVSPDCRSAAAAAGGERGGPAGAAAERATGEPASAAGPEQASVPVSSAARTAQAPEAAPGGQADAAAGGLVQQQASGMRCVLEEASATRCGDALLAGPASPVTGAFTALPAKGADPAACTERAQSLAADAAAARGPPGELDVPAAASSAPHAEAGGSASAAGAAGSAVSACAHDTGSGTAQHSIRSPTAGSGGASGAAAAVGIGGGGLTCCAGSGTAHLCTGERSQVTAHQARAGARVRGRAGRTRQHVAVGLPSINP